MILELHSILLLLNSVPSPCSLDPRLFDFRALKPRGTCNSRWSPIFQQDFELHFPSSVQRGVDKTPAGLGLSCSRSHFNALATTDMKRGPQTAKGGGNHPHCEAPSTCFCGYTYSSRGSHLGAERQLWCCWMTLACWRKSFTC